MKVLYSIALILVIIGAINWGAYASNFNLVTKLLGKVPYAEKAVYYIVAIAGIYVSVASLTSSTSTTSSTSQYIRNERQRKY